MFGCLTHLYGEVNTSSFFMCSQCPKSLQMKYNLMMSDAFLLANYNPARMSSPWLVFNTTVISILPKDSCLYRCPYSCRRRSGSSPLQSWRLCSWVKTRHYHMCSTRAGSLRQSCSNIIQTYKNNTKHFNLKMNSP